MNDLIFPLKQKKSDSRSNSEEEALKDRKREKKRKTEAPGSINPL